jgi:hypothetical protein
MADEELLRCEGLPPVASNKNVGAVVKGITQDLRNADQSACDPDDDGTTFGEDRTLNWAVSQLASK